MTTATASAQRKRSCSRKFAGRGGATRPCNRKPIWVISYLGAFCNYHFEDYLTSHAVGPADIERLSDDERDFVVRAEPGKGHSGNHPKPRLRQVEPPETIEPIGSISEVTR
jgi:hypothetical protein